MPVLHSPKSLPPPASAFVFQTSVHRNRPSWAGKWSQCLVPPSYTVRVLPLISAEGSIYQEHGGLPVVSSMWLLVPSANLQLVPTVNSSVAWVYGEGRQSPPF